MNKKEGESRAKMMRKNMKNDEVKPRKTLLLRRESEVLSKSTNSRNDQKKYPKIMKKTT